MCSRKTKIAVVGAGRCSREVTQLAREVGQEVARKGAVLICGGLGGVMEAAARGAREAGGLTVGILPGDRSVDANPYIDVAIATGMGHARNVILVQSADAVIAVSGGYGTLSEIAIALKAGIPCIGLETWDLGRGIVLQKDPAQAVQKAFELIRKPGQV